MLLQSWASVPCFCTYRCPLRLYGKAKLLECTWWCFANGYQRKPGTRSYHGRVMTSSFPSSVWPFSIFSLHQLHCCQYKEWKKKIPPKSQTYTGLPFIQMLGKCLLFFCQCESRWLLGLSQRCLLVLIWLNLSTAVISNTLFQCFD